MGTGRYHSKHTSALPQGVRDITKKIDLSGYRIYKNAKEANSNTSKDTKSFEEYADNNKLTYAIVDYTGNSYRYLNSLSRDRRYANMTTDEMIRDLQNRAAAGEVSSYDVQRVVDIHKALEQGTVTEAFVGYRGAGYSLLFGNSRKRSFAELQKLVGTTVRDTGNMSVSMVKGTEFKRDVLYEVKVPSGKGIGANIMGISNLGTSETEFLFNNGAYYKIVGVTKMSNGKPKVTLEYIGRG